MSGSMVGCDVNNTLYDTDKMDCISLNRTGTGPVGNGVPYVYYLITGIVMTVLCIVGIAANGLVLLVFLR